jgi:hypothetical protein
MVELVPWARTSPGNRAAFHAAARGDGRERACVRAKGKTPMSFTASTLPSRMGSPTARSLMRSGSLASMARALGVVVSAGFMAVSYQIAYDEGRAIVQGMQSNAGFRRARNDALRLALFNSGLPLELQEALRRSRDVFRTAMNALTDQTINEEHRTIIHGILTRTVSHEVQS